MLTSYKVSLKGSPHKYEIHSLDHEEFEQISICFCSNNCNSQGEHIVEIHNLNSRELVCAMKVHVELSFSATKAVVDNQPSPCDELLESNFIAHIETLGRYYNDQDFYENGDEDNCPFSEYALCLDKVEAGTFHNQDDPYYRYQLAYGGYTEEIRIYRNHTALYHILNWDCSANTQLSETQAEMLINLLGISEALYEL